MPSRTYPSYRLFRDHRNRWRWSYDLNEHEAIAASSDSYDSREACERMIALLRSSNGAPLWIAELDLVNGRGKQRH